MLRNLAFASALTLSLGAAAQASPVTFTATVGGTSGIANPEYFNFASPLPAGVSLSIGGDGAIETGSTVAGDPPPGFAAPYLSNNQGAVLGVSPANGPETTAYLASGVGGQTRIDFASSQTAFGVLLGSADPYQYFQFLNGDSVIQTINVADIVPGANGDRGPNGTVWIDFFSTLPFNEFLISSSQYAAEIGAGAIAGPASNVSEPGSLAMLGVGLAFLGLRGRSRMTACV